MMTKGDARFLRRKGTNLVFAWNPIMAMREDVEEVSESSKDESIRVFESETEKRQRDFQDAKTTKNQVPSDKKIPMEDIIEGKTAIASHAENNPSMPLMTPMPIIKMTKDQIIAELKTYPEIAIDESLVRGPLAAALSKIRKEKA